MANILVFGMGNVGTVYSMILHHAGAKVFCVCRSSCSAAKTNGLTVRSSIFGEKTFHPVIVSTVEEAVRRAGTRPFDFVLVCTKAVPMEYPNNPPTLLQSAISPGITSIVVIQNGLGVERPYKEAFPDNTIVSGVTYLPTTQISPGVVSHTETQRLHLGTFPASSPTSTEYANVNRFAQILRAYPGDVDTTVHHDVQIERWKKLIGNAT